jgi:glycosyltransferase involved in cell wall biosynthesis
LYLEGVKLKISIIVPVYKDKKNLDLFLNKIYFQTNKSYELILIVDTNIDNVLSVIDSYKEKFKSKLKLIFNTKRISRISAINMGISIANGDYSIINSIQNNFNNKLIEEILFIVSNHKSDVIEFKCSFSKPFKFNGKIRKTFKERTYIEKHPEIHAFSYPFDFNKIYKTEVLKITKKFTFPVQDNSRYSIEINYKALLVSKTYSTVDKTLIISNGTISQNFNPLKLIRQ